MQRGKFSIVAVIIAGLGAMAGYGIHWTGVETRLLPPDAVLPDGAEYHGDIRDGRFHGEGVLIRPNGDRYEGGFAEGVFEGKGRYVTATGDVHEGEFTNGMFHGRGTFTSAGGEVHEGRFEQWRIVQGVYRDSAGNEYEGTFEDWQFHGEGTYTAANGDVYRGTFERGQLTGEGVHEMASGGRYEGEFRNWSYHGTGTLTQADGDRHVGEFAAGYRHGEGRLEYADSERVRQGIWSWGEYQGADGRRARRRAEAIERALYRQPELLRAKLDGVAAGTPGEIELYFVGVAPYGGQDVFRREIDFVAGQFAREHDAGERSIVLGNHPDTLDSRPLATRTSIGRALERVSSAMNADEDILFLYLTSHGTRDHELSVQQPGLELPDLGADELASLVNGLPVRWKIVAISACYSGGFLPALEDERTLVMTAAREDRTSFGCGDDSEMTYFGKAYFRDALPETGSFRDAFEQARTLIHEWEEEEGLDTHSEPQIAIGDALERYLDDWRRNRRVP